VVEQIIRPTGLIDPEIQLKPISGQIDDLIGEIRAVTARGHRVLVTTLTKRMAEDLTDYLAEVGSRSSVPPGLLTPRYSSSRSVGRSMT